MRLTYPDSSSAASGELDRGLASVGDLASSREHVELRHPLHPPYHVFPISLALQWRRLCSICATLSPPSWCGCFQPSFSAPKDILLGRRSLRVSATLWLPTSNLGASAQMCASQSSSLLLSLPAASTTSAPRLLRTHRKRCLRPTLPTS